MHLEQVQINLLHTTKSRQLLSESLESSNLIWNGIPMGTVVYNVDGTVVLITVHN